MHLITRQLPGSAHAEGLCRVPGLQCARRLMLTHAERYDFRWFARDLARVGAETVELLAEGFVLPHDSPERIRLTLLTHERNTERSVDERIRLGEKVENLHHEYIRTLGALPSELDACECDCTTCRYW